MEWGSFSCLRLSTEHSSASGLTNRTSPSFLTLFKSVACVCHQPDNSRTPARIAATRREHFQERFWPNPSDISTTKHVPIRYSPSVFFFFFAAQIPYNVLSTHTWLSVNGRHFGEYWRKGATGGSWISRNQQSESKRAVFFREGAAPPLWRHRTETPPHHRQRGFASLLFAQVILL